MLANKTELLQMNPTDYIFLPVMNYGDNEIIDFSERVDHLTITFPDSDIRYAIGLSDKKAVEMFKKMDNLRLQSSLHFCKVQIKHLFPILIANKFAFLVDPFGESLVTLTTLEMCEYCTKYQRDIYDGNLNNIIFLRFRTAQAVAQGVDAKRALLKELIALEPFYVVCPALQPASPFVRQISDIMIAPHIMLFSSFDMAANYCTHINQAAKQNPLWSAIVPVKITTAGLMRIVENNPQAKVDRFYLNDGVAPISLSYQDFVSASSRT